MFSVLTVGHDVANAGNCAVKGGRAGASRGVWYIYVLLHRSGKMKC